MRAGWPRKSMEIVLPDPEGIFKFAMPAVSRIAISLQEDLIQTNWENSSEYRLGRNRGLKSKRDASLGGVGYEAYELVGGELRPIPIGASFDSQKGILYWQPGPGFQGEFRFVIVDIAQGTKMKINIAIGQ